MQSMKTSWLKIVKANTTKALLFALALGLLTIWAAEYLPLRISFPYYDTDLAPHYARSLATYAHFDGIHYLRLAEHGYKDDGSQAFFPLYPLLIRTLSLWFDPLISGMIISLCALVGIGIGLGKLFGHESRIWFLLTFPTAFYLVMVYTESLYLMLTIWFFVALARQRYWASALCAACATATRFIGFSLVIILAWQLVRSKLSVWKKLGLLGVAGSGLGMYMAYLAHTFHDPLLFFHVQPLFGGSRSGGELILLPQVIYRYFKILIGGDWQSWVYQRACLEFAALWYGLVYIVHAIRTRQYQIALYLALNLLVPTMTGTLSSLPRYLLASAPWMVPQNPHLRRLTIIIGSVLTTILFFKYAMGIFVS